ncbi:hypothetical protein [Microbacterium aurugineum]|uniref:hypothetical protein n=1 Tax=Microbacterium aurugineum TaxID=2851642 RepID=UPI0020C07BE1|nr:hypothetical protein [Microbacterium aurugineum]MCK8476917.1 hypothetical protein [Microbacterium aurugineum]
MTAAAQPELVSYSPEDGLQENHQETRKLGDDLSAADAEHPMVSEQRRKINASEGGGLLGSPAPASPRFVTENRNPVVQKSVSAEARVYLEVVSTPDEIAAAAAFFADTRAAETAGQRQRANRQHGSVFGLMQYRQNARTGRVMLTQEAIDTGLERLRDLDVLDLYADVWQSRDTYNPKGAVERTAKGWGVVNPGDRVPLHWHGVIMLKRGRDLTIRQVSDVFEIPSARIRLPREALGDDAPKGRGAARRAFLDLCAYLTHELVVGDHGE